MDIEILTTLTGIDRVNAIVAHIESLTQDQRGSTTRAYQRNLPNWEASKLKHAWHLHARDSQLPPEEDWDTWLILAGRGFGKTRTGAEWVRAQVENRHAPPNSPRSPYPPRSQSIMIEGESASSTSALYGTSPPTSRPSVTHLAQRSFRTRLLQPRTRPAQRPAVRRRMVRRTRIMGIPNQTWDNLNFALRLGQRPRSVVTTTPKPIEMVRSLPNKPGVYVTRGSTYENQDNLAPSFFKGITDQYDGTRIGRQEIYAELMDEDEDALWKREWIEKARISSPHPCPASSSPSTPPCPPSHKLRDRHRRSRRRRPPKTGLRPSRRVRPPHPNSWALRAIHLYEKFNAMRIVVEANAGGQMAESTIQNAVDRTISVKTLHARRGKYIRAEPVASLYEQGRVHHVGRFPELEDQMCTWTADLGPSPLPRPRRRPSPRHHRPNPRPQPHHDLVNPTP